MKISWHFADRVPQLPDAIDSYPAALPSHLYQDGYGRNRTLFLVMPRYLFVIWICIIFEAPCFLQSCVHQDGYTVNLSFTTHPFYDPPFLWPPFLWPTLFMIPLFMIPLFTTHPFYDPPFYDHLSYTTSFSGMDDL